MTGEWLVKIPIGRWMEGPHWFKTMRAANEFMAKYNQTELRSGLTELNFVRIKGTKHFVHSRT